MGYKNLGAWSAPELFMHDKRAARDLETTPPRQNALDLSGRSDQFQS
jgi:serine/threonine protein kinase